jgi:hypothetical protein
VCPAGWGHFDYAAIFDPTVETVRVDPIRDADIRTRENFPSIVAGIKRGERFCYERGDLVTSLLIEIGPVYRHPWDLQNRGSTHGHHLFSALIRRHGSKEMPMDSSWLSWGGGIVTAMAEGIQNDKAFGRLPILGDALEEAGCDNTEILTHCRQSGEHGARCWVIDMILGKPAGYAE